MWCALNLQIRNTAGYFLFVNIWAIVFNFTIVRICKWSVETLKVIDEGGEHWEARFSEKYMDAPTPFQYIRFPEIFQYMSFSYIFRNISVHVLFINFILQNPKRYWIMYTQNWVTCPLATVEAYIISGFCCHFKDKENGKSRASIIYTLYNWFMSMH